MLSTLLLAAVLAQPQWSLDWKPLEAEIFEHYSNLVRIDTSNPPGNETKAAEYLKRVLARDLIQSQIFELEPGRGNLVARIKGNGKKKPILLMGHLDVVGVQRDKWSVDPFGAIRKDGYVYGRGTIDDKDKVTSALMVMLALKRMKGALDRDVIFLAEAGEEGDSRVGIEFMIAQHWDAIECEYAVTEGGGNTSRDGNVRTVGIATTEKVPRGVRLVAHGEAGHGSRPRPDNALLHLSQAIVKVAGTQPPMRLNDTTRAYFERLASISTPEEAARYRSLLKPGPSVAATEAYLAKNELGHYSMLRTSVSPTILKGGFRSNVIPSEAEATLDIRALPDEDPAAFYEFLRKQINDPAVEVIPTRGSGRESGAPSRIDSELFRIFEATQKAMYPGAITLPVMLTGATDNSQLRAKGVQAYGFGPTVDEKVALGPGGAHGDDEKLKEESLYKEVDFLWRAVFALAGAK